MVFLGSESCKLVLYVVLFTSIVPLVLVCGRNDRLVGSVSLFLVLVFLRTAYSHLTNASGSRPAYPQWLNWILALCGLVLLVEPHTNPHVQNWEACVLSVAGGLVFYQQVRPHPPSDIFPYLETQEFTIPNHVNSGRDRIVSKDDRELDWLLEGFGDISDD